MPLRAAVLPGLLTLLLFVRAATSAEPAPPAPAATPLPPRSTVVAVRDERAVSSRLRPDPAVVRAMVDRAVMAVTERGDVASAWRALVSPNDVVGIKIAAAGGPLGSTRKPVVAAIVEGLVAAGVPRSRIVIWDRDVDELRASGWLAPGAAGGLSARPIPPRGYDRSIYYTSSALGKLMWGDLDFVVTSPLAESLRILPQPGDVRPTDARSGDDEGFGVRSYFATILTKHVTKIINVPTLSDSVHTGVAGCLYNMTLPNIDNWRRFYFVKPFGMSTPRNTPDPYLAEIYSDPLIAPRVVLNVLDGLVAQYAGGPDFRPTYCIPHATLYASRDPVALDFIALRLIEEWRAQAKMPPVDAAAKYLKTAEEIKLGHATLDKIDIRRLSP